MQNKIASNYNSCVGRSLRVQTLEKSAKTKKVCLVVAMSTANAPFESKELLSAQNVSLERIHL